MQSVGTTTSSSPGDVALTEVSNTIATPAPAAVASLVEAAPPSPSIGDAQVAPAAPTPAPITNDGGITTIISTNGESKSPVSSSTPHVVTIHTGDTLASGSIASSGATSSAPAAVATASTPRPDPSQPVTDPSVWQYPWETSCDMETAEKRRCEQQEVII
jgi:hypothetical protein